MKHDCHGYIDQIWNQPEKVYVRVGITRYLMQIYYRYLVES